MTSAFPSPLRHKVLNVYKQLLFLGKDYPLGYPWFKSRLKNAFMKNREITDPKKIEKCIEQAEYVTKEIETMYYLKKYREMKKRYE